MRGVLGGVRAVACGCALMIVVSGCGLFGWGKSDRAIERSAPGLTVSVPEAALDDGADLRVARVPVRADASEALAGTSPLPDAAYEVSTTKGSLDGVATFTFGYPATLPAGVTPEDLVVSYYDPQLRTKVPVPAVLDTEHRTLTIALNHFTYVSVDAANSDDELVEAAVEAGKATTGDVLDNPNDPLQPFLARLYPTAPTLTCDPVSPVLRVTVVDFGEPGARAACAQSGASDRVVTLKFVNTKTYPVSVHLPPGVEATPAVPDTSDFAEFVSQLEASMLGRKSFLLRGGHTVTLRVRLDQLRAGAAVTADVDDSVLLADMSLWTLQMAASGSTKWSELQKRLLQDKNLADEFTGCVSKAADQWRANKPDEAAAQTPAARKKAAAALLDAVQTCTGAVSNLVKRVSENKKKGVFAAVTGKVKGTVINPIATKLNRLTSLWKNPTIINEWVTGLLAATYEKLPGNASRVTITLEATKAGALDPVATDTASPVPDGDTGAYVTAVSATASQVRIDKVDIFDATEVGKEGVRAACRADGVGGGDSWWCNDLYFRNRDTTTHVLNVAPGASIKIIDLRSADLATPVPGTLADLAQWFRPGTDYAICRISVRGNTVTSIAQIFTP